MFLRAQWKVMLENINVVWRTSGAQTTQPFSWDSYITRHCDEVYEMYLTIFALFYIYSCNLTTDYFMNIDI